MSLRLASRFAKRELRGGLKGFWVFLTCLSLGVAAIATVGSVRTAIQAGLAREGAALLGGDAELEFTYRFADAAEQDWMRSVALNQSEIADFRSMVVVDEARGLTQIKAVDGAYPLVGSVVLNPPLALDVALAGENGLPGAVMAPLLVAQMELAAGDTFKLGQQEFVLMATLMTEPDSAGDGFALGPRTLVHKSGLDASGLLQPGTLFSSKYRLDLSEDADLETLKQEALATFPNSGLRWRDARNGAPGIASFVNRLGAFLILVGLSGLVVGGVGVSTAVRAYLVKKTSVIATLRSLGADQKVIFLTYFLQIGVLACFGIVLGVILGGLLPVLAGPPSNAKLPVPAVFAIYPAPLLEAALYGALIALIFTLWPLARSAEVRAATLLRSNSEGDFGRPPVRFILIIVALVVAMVAIAAAFSGTIRLTFWTAGGMVGALVLLSLAAFGLRRLARRTAPLARGKATWRWALAAIGAGRDETTPVVLALGLGLSVLAAVGQIDGNLRQAIAQELPERAPSFFFVDIQKDQIDGFLTRLEDPHVSRVEHAPMLRGIITKINDRPAAEVAGDHWVIRGDRGITYAGAQPANTKITQGAWWPETYAGAPQISFAAEEAAEMGLTLGDTLSINVLGREITGTVTSLREVDFSAAGMGFVLAMNEAALAGAPHSFIATVYASQEAEATLLRDLTNQYPNITAISVRDAIERVSLLMAGIASATRWGAGATLLTGFVVLIGAAATGAPARAYEAAILKTLGATRRRIMTSFALRAALIGIGAGSVALFAGIAGGWAVMKFVMESDFHVIWGPALTIILGGVCATSLAGLGFAWQALASRPARILRNAD